jgi:RNA polymerase sigma factor (TIGR02999 family)
MKSVPPGTSYPVTELLTRWSSGDTSARDALVPLVYSELRKIARRCLAGQRSGHTLQPTALVHEAYLRLVRYDSIDWRDRAHFFALAAQIMRQILVDHARKQTAAKRGGNAVTVVVDEASAASKQASLDLLALDDALRQLASLDPRQSQIVELRFFGGLSIEETAEAVNISPATIKREWATARLWLLQEMSGGAEL